MASDIRVLLLKSWSQQRDYAERLVADLSEADMVSQPVPGVVMNHPAWVLGHLSAYPPVLTTMLSRLKPEDPKDHPFGKESRPQGDVSVYGSKASIVGEYLRVHDELAATLERVDAAVLHDPIGVDRWRERFPTVQDASFYLMTSHESTHLGQLSAWRRAGGRPSV